MWRSPLLTHKDLAEALYVAYCNSGDTDPENWNDLEIDQKRCWLAVAEAAWELVEGESAAWAKSAMQREEDLLEIVVEFMNKAEALIS